MFEPAQVQKSSENEPKNGGADNVDNINISAPASPRKPLINYPSPARMREISDALAIYIAERDGAVFDVPAILSTDNPTNE